MILDKAYTHTYKATGKLSPNLCIFIYFFEKLCFHLIKHIQTTNNNTLLYCNYYFNNNHTTMCIDVQQNIYLIIVLRCCICSIWNIYFFVVPVLEGQERKKKNDHKTIRYSFYSVATNVQNHVNAMRND